MMVISITLPRRRWHQKEVLTDRVGARGLAEEKEVRWLQAETLRLTGDVLLATGDAAAAEASYRDARGVKPRAVIKREITGPGMP
jgi:predicted negative regulator of RcsB-dependent stress response